jgi:hypothetical protein
VTAEHVAHIAGAGFVPQFLEFAAEALVTPGTIFLGQAKDQRLAVLGLPRTSWGFGLARIYRVNRISAAFQLS